MGTPWIGDKITAPAGRSAGRVFSCVVRRGSATEDFVSGPRRGGGADGTRSPAAEKARLGYIAGMNACDRYRNIETPSRISSEASAISSLDPIAFVSSSRSISLAFLMKRIMASATMAVPATISASPAMLPNLCPSGDRTRPESDGATVSRKRSKRSSRNPNAMTAMAVRIQARKVRSFASWSRKFLIVIRHGLLVTPASMAPMPLLPQSCKAKSGFLIPPPAQRWGGWPGEASWRSRVGWGGAQQERREREPSNSRPPLQHPGNAEVFVEFGPVNAHRHQLEAPARRGALASRSRGYQASGVAIRRPSASVTTSSSAVKATETGLISPTSISKVLMPFAFEEVALRSQVADNSANFMSAAGFLIPPPAQRGGGWLAEGQSGGGRLRGHALTEWPFGSA